MVFTGLNGCSDCFPNYFEHLVMAPVVTSVGKGFGAAAEKMFEGILSKHTGARKISQSCHRHRYHRELGQEIWCKCEAGRNPIK